MEKEADRELVAVRTRNCRPLLSVSADQCKTAVAECFRQIKLEMNWCSVTIAVNIYYGVFRDERSLGDVPALS